MLSLIVLGVSFILTLGLVFYLFNKLTPDNAPDNLAGYFASILKFAVATVIAVYVALFIVQIFLG